MVTRGWGTDRGVELERGSVDDETGQKNYVNPWEQEYVVPGQLNKDGEPLKQGQRYFRYEGPVYKQVPVVDGLNFPLDPALYYPPLEPPPPGAKWGDGRDTDGNWYLKEGDKLVLDEDGNKVQYWQGWGRRKVACAIVRIVKGTGQFFVNGRDASEYMDHYPIWWLKACEPLAALSMKNDYDILAKVFGGGISGQAGAVRLALARALQELDYNLRPLLKKGMYLFRDPRVVEPKKPGQPKARKKTPYHKR